MTPNEARILRANASPGPWTAYAWERHPGSDVYIKDRDGSPVTSDGWISPFDGDLIASAPDMATTIIEQGEKIKRLQKALSLNVVRSGTNPMTRFEYMYEREELLPGDMD